LKNNLNLGYPTIKNILTQLNSTQLNSKNIKSSKVEVIINTSSYQAGIYIVVFKQNNIIISQQKL
jgi:hypothetical protein